MIAVASSHWWLGVSLCVCNGLLSVRLGIYVQPTKAVVPSPSSQPRNRDGLGFACALRCLAPRSADVKTSLMELHDLGPCKLFDTAGLDEPGELGAKKRAKVGMLSVPPAM